MLFRFKQEPLDLKQFIEHTTFFPARFGAEVKDGDLDVAVLDEK